MGINLNWNYKDYDNLILKNGNSQDGIYYNKYPTQIPNSNTASLYTDNILCNKSNVFEVLSRAGHHFWINQNGNIIYSHYDKTSQILFQNLEWFLSSLSKKNVKIFKTRLELDKWHIKNQKEIEKIKDSLKKLIHDYNKIYAVSLDILPIVLGEVFDVRKPKVITNDDRATFYINTFCPSDNLIACNYMLLNQYSITMQYIYYLSGYSASKFNYIMSWLLNMVKIIAGRDDIELKLLSSILILVGSKNSGKEIFFNNIIKPLFGGKYCLAIDDNKLSDKKLEKEITNKIFYNFDNISSKNIADKKDILQDILLKKDNNILGTIITTDRQYLPYEFQNIEYVVFKVPDDIESIYLRDEYKFENIQSNLTNDLINFSTQLKYYWSNIPLTYAKDIDITKEPNLDDCIAEFAKELIFNANILDDIKSVIMLDKTTNQELNNIQTLYNKHKKIERKYIKRLFNHRYGFNISSKVLYSQLEKLDPELFKKVLAPGGAKCFYLPNSN